MTITMYQKLQVVLDKQTEITKTMTITITRTNHKVFIYETEITLTILITRQITRYTKHSN